MARLACHEIINNDLDVLFLGSSRKGVLEGLRAT